MKEVKGDTFTVPSWERQSLHIVSCSVGSTGSSSQVISDQVLAGCAPWLFQQKFPCRFRRANYKSPFCLKGHTDAES